MNVDRVIVLLKARLKLVIEILDLKVKTDNFLNLNRESMHSVFCLGQEERNGLAQFKDINLIDKFDAFAALSSPNSYPFIQNTQKEKLEEYRNELVLILKEFNKTLSVE